MSKIVTIEMYSGRPNPTWELTDAQAAELEELMRAKEGISPIAVHATPGRLGYRGISIESTDKGIGFRTAKAFDGLFQPPQLGSPSLIDEDSQLEKYLLNTAGARITAEERAIIETEIEKNGDSAPGANISSILLTGAPPFNPSKWNDDYVVLRSNNCYNYANDLITNTFAQPGRGTGAEPSPPPTCSTTGSAAVSDGQVVVSNPNQSFAEGQLIALVTSVAWTDYHWYRRDADGYWSHKPGGTPATNQDNSGSRISNPETCDRGPYETFCGYYHCIPSNVTIR